MAYCVLTIMAASTGSYGAALLETALAIACWYVGMAAYCALHASETSGDPRVTERAARAARATEAADHI